VNIDNQPLQTPRAPQPHTESLEGQVALRITAQLSRGTESLPHDITERLRFGRERALALALQQRRAATAAVASHPVAVSGRAAVLGGPPSVWLRLASALPLVVLVAGLVLIQHHHDFEQITAAAEIDSALLADELPPAAYGDPGFAEFLHSAEAP
jgi:hypothetical protein